MTWTYLNSEVAYLGTLLLAFVVAEFALAGAGSGSGVPRRLCQMLVYLAAVLPAPSGSRIVGLVPLAGGLALCDALAGVRGSEELGSRAGTAARAAPRQGPSASVARFGATLGKVALVAAYAALTLRSRAPLFPNPVVFSSWPLARVLVWASVYVFLLPGGTAAVRWVLDEVSPRWKAAALGVAPGRRAGVDSVPAPGHPAAGLPDVAGRVAAAADETAAGLDGAGRPDPATGVDYAGRPEPAGSEPRRGRVIGCLERLIVTTLVTQGQYGAIGLVLAAKSVARYPQAARSEEFADYYLIGTLVSMAVAIFAGLFLAGADRALLPGG